MENYFNKLNSINVSDKVEKKNGLSYVSWSYAWAEVKKVHPDANYTVEKFGEKNLPYVLDEDTGYMVFTKVTINGITHEMFLPVMDATNKAMKNVPYDYTTKFGKGQVAAATMFDINKTIMRCLTKNLAMHGLGLYIYSGEDLPEEADHQVVKEVPEKIPDWDEIPEVKATLTKTITDAQAKRLFAISGGKQDLVKTAIGKLGYSATKDILLKDYETICKELEKLKGGK